MTNWLFELEIGVLKSPIPSPKNTNPQFKITNWSLYHQSVISTFSSLILYKEFHQKNLVFEKSCNRNRNMMKKVKQIFEYTSPKKLYLFSVQVGCSKRNSEV